MYEPFALGPAAVPLMAEEPGPVAVAALCFVPCIEHRPVRTAVEEGLKVVYVGSEFHCGLTRQSRILMGVSLIC